VIAKPRKGRPWAGIGTNKIYSICIHKNCDQNTKRKIISNLLLQVLPYAISPIAHSDLVFGKQIFLFIS
jgi:hypothetical protein